MQDIGKFNTVVPVTPTPPARKPGVQRKPGASEEGRSYEKQPKSRRKPPDDSDGPHIDEYA